jgi:hypothetical protein
LNASRSNAHRWIVPGLPPSHVQPGEIRTAVGIAGYNLAVEHCRFSWELVQQLGDRREALGKVVPVTAVMTIREPALWACTR